MSVIFYDSTYNKIKYIIMLTETKQNIVVTPDYRVILEGTDDLIYALDHNYRILYCNSSFKKSVKALWDVEIKEGYLLPSVSNRKNNNYAKELQELYQKAFAGIRNEKKLSVSVGDKTFTTIYKAVPIFKNNEIGYIQITAKEKLNNGLNDEEIEIIKTELLSEKDKLIKEKNETVQLLLDNTERLQMVLDGSDDAFWDWDFEKDTIFYSHNHSKILGADISEQAANFYMWRQRIHPDDIDKMLDNLVSHLEGETKQYRCEYRVKAEDNSWKWVLDKGKVVIRNEEGKPIRIAGIVSDITKRKEFELKLKESEERFESMTNDLPVMVWLSDRKLNLTYQNILTSDFLGDNAYEKHNLIDIIVHPDDLQFLKQFFRDIFRYKSKSSAEIRLKNSKGKYRWILMSVVPRVLPNNEIIGFLGVGLDITERKQTEKKLLDSEAQFNEITSVVGEGIFLIDTDWNLKFANPEFEKLLGYSLEELKDRNVKDIVHDDFHIESDVCHLDNVIQRGEIVRIAEASFRKKNGDIIPVSYVSSPIKRNGKVTGCVTAFHDISERKQLDEEISRFVEELQFNKELFEDNAREFAQLNKILEESEERLKQLNGSKDKFFSIISHDLRSPFTSITGYSEVILDDIDELSKEEIKEFAGSIHKSAKNIQNLLENLLQWSRMQTGGIKFNPNIIKLSDVVEEIVDLYQVNAARKKITLVNDLDNDYPLKADKFMLNTILRNLVSNSIKFTKKYGTIGISAKENLTKKEVEITVTDTGLGMSEEIKNKLFKIDEHVSTKGTEKEKGTGLGLILSKEFVEKHGGKIWVESELGIGSKFKFTIPTE